MHPNAPQKSQTSFPGRIEAEKAGVGAGKIAGNHLSPAMARFPAIFEVEPGVAETTGMRPRNVGRHFPGLLVPIGGGERPLMAGSALGGRRKSSRRRRWLGFRRSSNRFLGARKLRGDVPRDLGGDLLVLKC